MRKVILISLLFVGLSGCASRTVAQMPIEEQPHPASTAALPPTGSAVICPNGVQVPAGATC
jgi:hypothetical protein